MRVLVTGIEGFVGGHLEARLTALGWDASVNAEDPFYWGQARRAAGGR